MGKLIDHVALDGLLGGLNFLSSRSEEMLQISLERLSFAEFVIAIPNYNWPYKILPQTFFHPGLVPHHIGHPILLRGGWNVCGGH